MMKTIQAHIAASLHLQEWQVVNALTLLSEGATIPFISRYRKERTGSLDEVQLEAIDEANRKLEDLQKRKAFILASMSEQGVLTDEFRQKINDTFSSFELEDLYLPFKPKRRTKATIARQKGLEPLANIIWGQKNDDLEQLASSYICEQVLTVEEALQGARDIMAEWINENEQARHQLRQLFRQTAVIEALVVKGKETEGIKYRDYFHVSEPLRRCSSHRLLAIRRGENEKILRVNLQPDVDQCLNALKRLFVRSSRQASVQVEMAVDDAFHRLLKPSLENEMAIESKQKADREAITIFAENLRQLLLAPPYGNKRVLAIDPGFRTACKVVCLDAQGQLLHHTVIFPHPPHSQPEEASKTILELIRTFSMEAVAVGNGTAGRETETFLRTFLPKDFPVIMVNEHGASVYSASATAREEFPNHDVTVRGAVSIGRRLMDPLSELVKIDPKSIGVGQYQHDVDQAELKKALDQTVIHCVNTVGVELNSAGRYLLMYVSGLGPQLAQNIVDYRTKNGPFRSRAELLKVPKMGPKTFEQSAGFLRIAMSENPLDNSAVHPENYPVVMKMASDLGVSLKVLIENKSLQKEIKPEKYVTDNIGLPTLTDILAELAQPGRDPRHQLESPSFDRSIQTLDDLKEGMILQGVVTNMTNFGVFVDIGIHEYGLVHLSNMADHFVRSPLEVVSLQQLVTVKVIGIDHERKRIQLSMKNI
ncbi:MAG: Tex family protein [Microbacter sp.]